MILTSKINSKISLLFFLFSFGHELCFAQRTDLNITAKEVCHAKRNFRHWGQNCSPTNATQNEISYCNGYKYFYQNYTKSCTDLSPDSLDYSTCIAYKADNVWGKSCDDPEFKNNPAAYQICLGLGYASKYNASCDDVSAENPMAKNVCIGVERAETYYSCETI